MCILHDRFHSISGSNRVAIEVARFLDAPIYTMYVEDGVTIPSDVDVVPIAQEKYQEGLSRRLLEGGSNTPLETINLLFDMTRAHDAIRSYDLVFESGPLSKHYIPAAEQSIISYPHSPSRTFYDMFPEVVSEFDYPLVGFVAKAYLGIMRAIDKSALDYVDEFVANSEVVRDRIRRYYGRESEIVYPPVTGDWRNEGDEGYFVTWSRLSPGKRVGLIAEAFAGLDEHLVIAGDGEQREQIETIASRHDNVEYRGYVENIESLVANATAVVYAPKNEDFGLVGAETMAAGKPLLGVNEGFTRHQVSTETGVLFEPTLQSLRETVRGFDPDDYDEKTIQAAAEHYSLDEFRDGLVSILSEYVDYVG